MSGFTGYIVNAKKRLKECFTLVLADSLPNDALDAVLPSRSASIFPLFTKSRIAFCLIVSRESAVLNSMKMILSSSNWIPSIGVPIKRKFSSLYGYCSKKGRNCSVIFPYFVLRLCFLEMRSVIRSCNSAFCLLLLL